MDFRLKFNAQTKLGEIKFLRKTKEFYCYELRLALTVDQFLGNICCKGDNKKSESTENSGN